MATLDELHVIHYDLDTDKERRVYSGTDVNDCVSRMEAMTAVAGNGFACVTYRGHMVAGYDSTGRFFKREIRDLKHLRWAEEVMTERWDSADGPNDE